jgi:hypothetical protein
LLTDGYEWTPARGEDHPTPNTYQIVTFVVHCECGFGVPPSRFLERVCQHYEIETAQILPNAIAMLSAFTILCEAWLGVERALSRSMVLLLFWNVFPEEFVRRVGWIHPEEQGKVYRFSDEVLLEGFKGKVVLY